MNVPPPRDRDDLIDRIRLLRTRNVGPVSFRQLLARFGAAAEALDRLPELSRRAGGSGVKLASRAAAAAELDAADAAGATVLALGDPAYPAALAVLEDAPPILFVRGDAARLNQPCVALVGARHASANGRTLAERMARDLVAAGYVVVSGLARGIDAAAHEGALAGGTVAVLAGGLDKIYPDEHVPLAEAIVAHDGAVVTEMPFGQAPRAQHFPRRNRLVSGLSSGVVVVQAARRSGSLITARLAGEQGREVFAVPGFPLDERHQGCNQLLREGAHLTETAGDVLAVLGRAELRETWLEPTYEVAVPPPDAAGDVESLAALIGPEPVPVDALIRRSGLTAPEVLTILLDLELAGRLDRHSGSHVSLRL